MAINDIRDLDDFYGEPLGPPKNQYLIKYNHSIRGFDMVSADNVLVKETETPLPEDFLEVLEDEMKLEDITEIGDVDGGNFQ